MVMRGSTGSRNVVVYVFLNENNINEYCVLATRHPQLLMVASWVAQHLQLYRGM